MSMGPMKSLTSPISQEERQEISPNPKRGLLKQIFEKAGTIHHPLNHHVKPLQVNQSTIVDSYSAIMV